MLKMKLNFHSEGQQGQQIRPRTPGPRGAKGRREAGGGGGRPAGTGVNRYTLHSTSADNRCSLDEETCSI